MGRIDSSLRLDLLLNQITKTMGLLTFSNREYHIVGFEGTIPILMTNVTLSQIDENKNDLELFNALAEQADSLFFLAVGTAYHTYCGRDCEKNSQNSITVLRVC